VVQFDEERASRAIRAAQIAPLRTADEVRHGEKVLLRMTRETAPLSCENRD
jgi:hypothetical protein